MPVVEHSTEINRTQADVFAYVADIGRTSEWISAIVEVRDCAPGPVQIGSTFTEIARFMGRIVETPKIVIALDPPRMLSHRSTGGPVPQTFTLEVEPIVGGSRLTARLEAEPGGFFGTLPVNVLVTAMKVIMTGDLRRLKESLESIAGARAAADESSLASSRLASS